MTNTDTIDFDAFTRTPRRFYMMATTALHKLGDLSAEKPDLCLIYGETADVYVGQWVEGAGFFNVRFPKATTRPLTDTDIGYYRGKVLVHSNGIREERYTEAELRNGYPA